MNFCKGVFFRHAIILLTMQLAACGPGISDYTKKLGDTGLTYVHNNSLGRTIGIIFETGEYQPVVGESVIKYILQKDTVFGVRQIVQHYICSGTRSDVEVTDILEYFLIASDLEPQFFEDYAGFSQSAQVKGLSLKYYEALRPSNVVELKLYPVELGECNDALRI